MTPKQELIQAIEQSPDDLVQVLLQLLKLWQRQRAQEDDAPIQAQTVLERMGGEPKHMLAVGGLSDRDRRREIIAKHLQQKHCQDRG